MKQLRTIALIALLVVLATSLPATALFKSTSYLPNVARQTATDLALLNPGFEGAFAEYTGAPELKVGEGWTPWWDENAHRPEYKRAGIEVDADRVHAGSSAQQWFNTYAAHTAGIYQRVYGVPVGQALVLEAWVQAFSSSDDDFEHSNGKYRMRIGLDPYGGLDPESSDVVWSGGGNAIEPYDEYAFLQVQATARSDRVTAFVWGQAEWPVKHNDAYVDDVRLYVLGDGLDGTPTPVPGALSEPDIRAIVRDEMAAVAREWADALSTPAP